MRSKVSLHTVAVLAMFVSNAHARYYDAPMGRFVSPDQIVQAPIDPQNLNRYAYVRNNPIMLTDPSGRSWLSHTIDKINHWADHNPIGSFVVQTIVSPVAGTAMLDRTKTGRMIIAGEIIAGTAYATGVGMVPANLGWGAVGGEMTGTYSAYKNNGSILIGATAGGVVGGAAGYYGFQGEKVFIGSNPTAIDIIEGEMFRGGMIGASQGFATSFKGGQGNFKSIVFAMVISGITDAVLNGAFSYIRIAALSGNGIGYPNGIPTGTPPLKYNAYRGINPHVIDSSMSDNLEVGSPLAKQEIVPGETYETQTSREFIH